MLAGNRRNKKRIPPPGEKNLSCQRCQFRKLKCSRTVPCSNCTTAEQDCQYRQHDEKRRPLAREYTRSLEDRVAWLESLLTDIKRAAPEQRDALLDSISFTDHLQPSQSQTSRPQSLFTANAAVAVPESRLQRNPEGSLIYHGPTSIYRIRLPADPNRSSDRPLASGSSNTGIRFTRESPAGRPSADAGFTQVLHHFDIRLEDDAVAQALALFFKWQYPFFMFIYRESFLRDHFGEREGGKYWSLSLLLAICAVGALMDASDAGSRQISERFFAAAESIVLVSGLGHPSVTTVQALLCMSFYEIGRGNLSKGWGYSGMACRMTQDLGIQRDPKHWLSHDATLVNSEDIEIRRRIYWGCYASDKLISLILGRPILLKEEDAEVDPPERLPEFPEMLQWQPAGYTELDQGASGSTILVQCFTEQVKLCSLVEALLCKLFSTKWAANEVSLQALVDSLNINLCRWEASLPTTIQWQRESGVNLIPHVAALHVLYHSVRVVLHLRVSSGPSITLGRDVCLSSMHHILSIIRRFRVVYGLSHAPLVFVYGLVQAFRASEVLGMAEEGRYALQTLDECAATWGLAKHIRKLIDCEAHDSEGI